MTTAPIPHNELDRIIALSDFNIDYSSFENNFKDLTKLAAKVAGTPISYVNLIDSNTQWTVSYFGLESFQYPREDTVCQYTIMEQDQFEVKDLSGDERFRDKDYVTDDPHFRYYFGVPLKYEGVSLGALCVLDKSVRESTLTPEKAEMIAIISDEIVNRLKVYKYIDHLRNNISEVKYTQNKVVHDIRGPIGGIMGLAEIISMQGKENSLDEVLEFINMIYKGGKSVLELADEILDNDKKRNRDVKANELTLALFKEKLEKLYAPQARSKNIALVITTNRDTEETVFPNNKLMQIAGNLVSNAIKFTPRFGTVTIGLDLLITPQEKTLTISVKDSGEGISAGRITELLGDNSTSTDGTGGEKGYGFGLALVKHLVHGLNGKLNITSEPPGGACFVVTLPYKV